MLTKNWRHYLDHGAHKRSVTRLDWPKIIYVFITKVFIHTIYISHLKTEYFFFVSVRYCVFFLLLPCISIVHFLCRFCYKYNNNIFFVAVLVFVGFVCSDHIIWWDVCHIPCIYKSIKKNPPVNTHRMRNKQFRSHRIFMQKCVSFDIILL